MKLTKSKVMKLTENETNLTLDRQIIKLPQIKVTEIEIGQNYPRLMKKSLEIRVLK